MLGAIRDNNTRIVCRHADPRRYISVPGSSSDRLLRCDSCVTDVSAMERLARLETQFENGRPDSAEAPDGDKKKTEDGEPEEDEPIEEDEDDFQDDDDYYQVSTGFHAIFMFGAVDKVDHTG